MYIYIYIYTQTEQSISAAVIEQLNRGAAKVSDRKDVIRVSLARNARYISFFRL